MAVTKTANVNVRIQENIKQQAEQILETIGIPSVAVKCVDIRKNTSGEGDFLDEN